MKKSLLILLTVLLLLTGCEKEENNVVKNDNTNQNTQEKVDNTNKEENTTSVENTTSENTATDNTASENTTPENTTPALGENEYISLKDNQVHKYTFTYPDEATCIKMGDGEPYEIVYPVKPYVLFGCEEVKDADGNILWGEYFLEHADENSVFYW